MYCRSLNLYQKLSISSFTLCLQNQLDESKERKVQNESLIIYPLF